MTSETLLPCPRCGGPAVHYNFTKGIHEVMCADDDCQLSNPFNYRTKEEAVAAWNTRSLPAALDRVIAEVEGRWPNSGEGLRALAYLRALRTAETTL